MSKLKKALGKKFEENKLSIMTRTFELGGHTFKVRVPSVKEIETIYEYFKNPNEEEVEKNYQDLTKDLLNVKNNATDGVEYQDNDIIIEGRSMRETAKNKTILQYRITEYFKFLIPENGESLTDLEYKDIEDEFPLAIQLSIVDGINEVISPGYKETRTK